MDRKGLDFLYRRLFEICRDCSREDWDGYDAVPVPLSAFVEAVKVLNLLPLDLPLPGIGPEPGGEIALEWYKGKGNIFSIGIGGDETITYAGLFGHGEEICGVEDFKNELPPVIIQNIRRLYDE